MQLPVRGHPLHTRSLTLVVRLLPDGRWHARGDVIDLRKCGFVPMMSDIQPAGIIHHMSIDLDVDPGSGRIDRVEVAQPVVAVEPGPGSGGECCRDPAPRLQALTGEHLDGALARRLSGVFGGPLGCSHLLTLFQLMSSGLQRALQLEAKVVEGAAARESGDRLFRRAVFVEGFESEAHADEPGSASPAAERSIEMAVQLADFHTRPIAARASPSARLAGQWDARVFARADGTARTLTGLRAARRERTFETIPTAAWHDESERLAPLEGKPMVPGLAKRLFAIFDAAGDRLLLDAGLQLAPGYIQVMAAVMDRWLGQAKQGDRLPDPAGPSGRTSMGDVGNIGGMPDSCYMWRSDGPMASQRAVRQRDPDDQP